MQREQFQALVLCGLSLANFLLFYLTSILLARTLSIREFDDYNVAVSTVLLLAAIATLGLEKYALRSLPTLRYAKDWSRSRGFLLFSQRLILTLCVVLLIFLGIALEGILAWRGSDYHIAIVIAALYLPVIALFQFVLEVVTSYGGQVKAVAIYRLLFPLVLLTLNALVWVSPAPGDAVSAVLCYGAAWLIAFAALLALFKRQTPASVWRAMPTYQTKSWLLGAWPLAASGIILTMFAQTGIIILELNHPNQSVVSAYALAFQTGTFVVLLATATNRLYSPQISELLASRDFHALHATAKRRFLLIGPMTIAFLLLIFFLGRSILAIFGPEFISAHPALCIVAVGASISTQFSLAPTYLHFTDRSRFVLTAMTTSVVFSLALCFPLSYYYGATGAALAYAIPISLLYGVLRVVAWRDFSRLLQEN